MHVLSPSFQQALHHVLRYGGRDSFAGTVPNMHLTTFLHRPLLYQWAHHKSWLYLSMTKGPWLFGIAVVDLGYAVQAFLFAYDAASRTLAADVSSLGPPGTGKVFQEGASSRTAWFHFAGLRINIQGDSTQYQVNVSHASLQLDVSLHAEHSPSALSAVSAQSPEFHLTEKTNLWTTKGTARLANETISLENGLAGCDYTEGYLPRHMNWNWAFAIGFADSGERVGFNLVDGALQEAECAVWVDQSMFPIDKGVFSFQPNQPHAPWTVQSKDGVVDVRFEPGGVHTENKNLLLVASRYLQAAGAFHGTITLPGHQPLHVQNLLGVTEDQHATW